MLGDLFVVAVGRSKKHFVPGGIEMSVAVLTWCVMFLALQSRVQGARSTVSKFTTLAPDVTQT